MNLARVNVEARALHDDAHKFRRMGHKLGVSQFDVYGRWLFVWELAQKKRSAWLSQDEIDGAADMPGFAAAAVSANLAREAPEGIYLCGMKERLETLENYLERTSKGGKRTQAKLRADCTRPDIPGLASAPASQLGSTPASKGPLVLESSSSSSKKKVITSEVSDVAISEQGKGRQKKDALKHPASPEAKAIAEYLRDAIRSHKPDFAGTHATVAKWARDIDLAMRLDGRTPIGLRLAIDFAHRSPDGIFWRPNILSGEKLRKQFDTLELQASRNRPREPDEEYRPRIHRAPPEVSS